VELALPETAVQVSPRASMAKSTAMREQMLKPMHLVREALVSEVASTLAVALVDLALLTATLEAMPVLQARAELVLEVTWASVAALTDLVLSMAEREVMLRAREEQALAVASTSAEVSAAMPVLAPMLAPMLVPVLALMPVLVARAELVLAVSSASAVVYTAPATAVSAATQMAPDLWAATLELTRMALARVAQALVGLLVSGED